MIKFDRIYLILITLVIKWHQILHAESNFKFLTLGAPGWGCLNGWTMLCTVQTVGHIRLPDIPLEQACN